MKSQPDKKRFEFVSEGPRGQIVKVVKFQRIGWRLYNLAFGDSGGENDVIDSIIRSNNGDRDKILVTVAMIVNEFMGRYVDANILVKGETLAKTRLYQMAINRHLREITALYKIEGYINWRWEQFMPGKNYSQFLLRPLDKT